MRATVWWAAISIMPEAGIAPNQRELKSHSGALGIQDLEDLLLVGARIGLHLLGVSGGRVALRPVGSPMRPGEISDQENDLVAELLELPHLVEQHRVPEMQVRRGGIEAGLDPERLATSSLRTSSLLGEQILYPAFEFSELCVEGFHIASSLTDRARTGGPPLTRQCARCSVPFG